MRASAAARRSRSARSEVRQGPSSRLGGCCDQRSAEASAPHRTSNLRFVHVAELWRYPIKSMAGERLSAVELSSDGFPGDRVMRVEDADGNQITARTKPELLALRATVNGDARSPLVDGVPWDSPAIAGA